jgi:hypothetical protein
LLVQVPAAKAEGVFAGEDVARDEDSICVISADSWRGRCLLLIAVTQTMVDRVSAGSICGPEGSLDEPTSRV